jgi:transcriptional regulator with XRE-family HTH domain
MNQAVLAQRPAAELPWQQELHSLLNALRSYQKSERPDRTDFGPLVAEAQRVLGVDDAELARRLGVSRPTIGRWARRETAPHPLGRNSVLMELASWTSEKLRIHSTLAKRRVA